MQEDSKLLDMFAKKSIKQQNLEDFNAGATDCNDL
jgi:hypothetical protein